jgi:MSHA biogenesis protein MshI
MAMQPGALDFAHGVCKSGTKSRITRCGTLPLEATPKDLERVAHELGTESYQCLTVLEPSEYQLLLVEAPNVPAEELKTAVRWRIKDMIDYHLEDATIDVLDIPVDPAGGARAHSMYVVSARNDIIQGRIERFSRAHIPLSVIDIAETAQRNVASLFEVADRGLAFLYVGRENALLTVNFRGELYLARRIDVGMEQLVKMRHGGSDELVNRIQLEVQRSFDHLDRQYPFVNIAKLVLGPQPEDTGLEAYLSANLGIPVERADLGKVLDFVAQAPLEGDAAWRLFHVLGAALRDEQKVL